MSLGKFVSLNFNQVHLSTRLQHHKIKKCQKMKVSNPRSDNPAQYWQTLTSTEHTSIQPTSWLFN